VNSVLMISPDIEPRFDSDALVRQSWTHGTGHGTAVPRAWGLYVALELLAGGQARTRYG
jgi:hypothetical protein